MPLLECKLNGKPGFKYGKSGSCYTHDGSDAGIADAKKKAVKQAIAIGAGKAPSDLSAGLDADDLAFVEALADEIEAEYAAKGGLDGVEALPTVTLKGVELLSEGGPYFGHGSPKGGDHFDAAYIKKLAADTSKLVDEYKEVRPPNKVGHSRAQKLLEASGETVAPDEKPAAGWLSNVKTAKRAGKLKIVGDLHGVPRKLARIIKAGGYRTRSVEIQTLTSQTDQKKYRVISGLAWLGEKAPAVRTLDDVIALYTDEQLTVGDDAEGFVLVLEQGDLDEDALVAALSTDDGVELAAGDLAWKPEEGYQWLRDQVNAALNPGMGMSRYWVRDVADTKALVTEYNGGESLAYVVPFTLTDGDVALSPSSDWVKVEQAWVDASKALADELAGTAYTARILDAITVGALGVPDVERVLADAADTSADMAPKPNENEKPELSDEQVAALATTFSIDEADDAKRRELVTAKLAEYAPAAAPVEPEKPKEEPKPNALADAELEVLKAKADRGDQAYEERRVERRDGKIEKALSEGRIEPSKKDFWVTAFDEDEDRASTLLAEMPVNPEFKAAYGSDDDGTQEGGGGEDAAYREYMGSVGYETDDLPSVAARKVAA